MKVRVQVQVRVQLQVKVQAIDELTATVRVLEQKLNEVLGADD